MRTPRASVGRLGRIAWLALLGIVPAPAFATTRLQWLQPAASEPVEEFRVYAGTSSVVGALVYSGFPSPQAGVYTADVQIDALDAGDPVYVWLTAWNPSGESGRSNAVLLEPPAPGCDPADSDCDGVLDADDNCPYLANPGQEDAGGLGAAAPPDGIGDACQCGDVDGDGRITSNDQLILKRALMSPPLAVMSHPELCDVGGSPGCTKTDATIVKRALFVPPQAKIQQQCAPAQPTPP